MSVPADLAQLARELAREAGERARELRERGVTIADTKSSIADIVTAADREVEALVRGRLAEAQPDDGFFGEESGVAPGASGITWVVDPIDGTVNYAVGIPNYCVSIAAVDTGTDPNSWRVLAGAVFAPALGELFSASLGGGAYVGERRLSVSEGPAAGALLGTGFGYDPATHDGDLAAVRAVLPLARDLRRIGAAALDLAYVAAGRLDGYFERGLQPWDWAAGSLLVTEAGGVFTRTEIDKRRPLTIAASQDLHERLSTALGVA